jgi:hypothetical protein
VLNTDTEQLGLASGNPTEYYRLSINTPHSAVDFEFGYSEKATKFKKIFHLKFDVTE